jgi:Interleukin-like EMT inducer
VTRRAHLLVFALALGLVAAYTWPLARDPAHLVPDVTDTRLFSWVMLSVFRNLLTRPHLLLHGSGFYPFGSSLTFAEPLLTPALVAGPLHAVSGNAWLAYNLTLLLFWAASGWAMYAVTYWITRRHAAAAVGMLVFTLSPPRIEYAVEFQMEIMFGLPLAVYALVRYLEEQRPRHLLALLAVFWLQATAVWYFAVILACGLVVLAVDFALRRWTGWQGRTLVQAGIGGLALGLALAPLAWPFFVTRREIGLERGLSDALGRSANLLTYLTTSGTWLHALLPLRSVAETTLYPGLVALGLAALAVIAAARDRPAGEGPRAGGWPERLVRFGMVASLGTAVLTVAGGGRLRVGAAWTKLPSVTACGVALVGCLLASAALAGWRRWQAGLGERRLGQAEWVCALLPVGLVALLLSFGPVVFLGRLRAGDGLYAWLHPYVLPLRVVRGTTRFGLLVLLVVALLAGLGTAWLLGRLSRRAAAIVALLLVAALLADYWHPPLRYARLPRPVTPVDLALAADPADVAVLDWPSNVPGADVDAKLRSIAHGKRVVNGFGGFVLEYHRQLSGALSETAPTFPSPAARAALARIYPLRYVVVHRARLSRAARAPWDALRGATAGPLRFRGTYGTDDLYEVVPLPESGLVLDRDVSYDFLRAHPGLRATLRPVWTAGEVEQWVALRLNGGLVTRERLVGEQTLTATLTGPLLRAAPNRITLEYGYRRGPAALGPEHRIGTTAVTSPVDIRVRSGGRPHGDLASIRVGLAELAPNRRGYNLVALDGAGQVRDRVAFDTHADASASPNLATWVRAQPAGTIVVGAAKDDASGRLGLDAVEALGTLGVRGTLHGRLAESHAFVGVKGAVPGAAVEALGPRAIEVRVGDPDAPRGFELLAFVLEPAAPGAR